MTLSPISNDNEAVIRAIADQQRIASRSSTPQVMSVAMTQDNTRLSVPQGTASPKADMIGQASRQAYHISLPEVERLVKQGDKMNKENFVKFVLESFQADIYLSPKDLESLRLRLMNMTSYQAMIINTVSVLSHIQEATSSDQTLRMTMKASDYAGEFIVNQNDLKQIPEHMRVKIEKYSNQITQMSAEAILQSREVLDAIANLDKQLGGNGAQIESIDHKRQALLTRAHNQNETVARLTKISAFLLDMRGRNRVAYAEEHKAEMAKLGFEVIVAPKTQTLSFKMDGQTFPFPPKELGIYLKAQFEKQEAIRKTILLDVRSLAEELLTAHAQTKEAIANLPDLKDKMMAFRSLMVASGLERAGSDNDDLSLEDEISLAEETFKTQQVIAGKVANLLKDPEMMALLSADAGSEPLAERPVTEANDLPSLQLVDGLFDASASEEGEAEKQLEKLTIEQRKANEEKREANRQLSDQITRSYLRGRIEEAQYQEERYERKLKREKTMENIEKKDERQLIDMQKTQQKMALQEQITQEKIAQQEVVKDEIRPT